MLLLNEDNIETVRVGLEAFLSLLKSINTNGRLEICKRKRLINEVLEVSFARI